LVGSPKLLRTSEREPDGSESKGRDRTQATCWLFEEILTLRSPIWRS
jgi:hypothetical protein